MSNHNINEILMCSSLPSLPAVAVQLLELTSDPDVSMSDIARLVQQDQALAAKVLKTVNSSYYGLSTPCSSIERAMGYLGLNTVKSLVLGFSLVDTMTGCTEGFDLEGHWRRAIIGATGARIIAQRVRVVDPDDAFTASLFQDMGMLACFVSLREEYTSAIKATPHRNLCAIENEVFGFDHATVGAELSQRWKLPKEITEAIRAHHDPEVATEAHQELARVVACGSMVCTCLEQEPPSSGGRTLERKSRDWFGSAAPDVDELLEEVRETSKTLAKLFGQEIGTIPSAAELIARATEQGLEHQVSMQKHADQLAREAFVDGLTRIANRKKFDRELRRCYDAFLSAGTGFGVIFFDADRFKGVNDTHGHAAGDAVLIELARRTTEAVGESGTVFRYGGEEFAVIVEGRDIDFCTDLGERVRSRFADEPFDLSAVEGAPKQLRVTASIGVSSTDAAEPTRLSGPEQVVREADECVYAAKSDGRDNVKVHARFEQAHSTNEIAPVHTDASPAGGTAGRILLIEDDALAATLVITLLKRRGLTDVQWVKSGSQACTLIEQGKLDGDRRPGVVLCDLKLPGCDGNEVLRTVRAHPALSDLSFYVLTGSDDRYIREESVRRGVSVYIHKDEFCADINTWLGKIVDAARPRCPASNQAA